MTAGFRTLGRPAPCSLLGCTNDAYVETRLKWLGGVFRLCHACALTLERGAFRVEQRPPAAGPSPRDLDAPAPGAQEE